MRHPGIRRQAVAGTWAIPRTVLVITQERPSSLRSAAGSRIATVDAAFPQRIDEHPLTGLASIGLLVVGIRAPLPDVARHVECTIAIRLKCSHRSGPHISISLRVLVRKLSLPEIGEDSRVARRFVTPDIRFSNQSATCCELPFCFGRQSLARPFGERDGIIPRDMHDRMLFPASQVAFGPFGVLPVRSGGPIPPFRVVFQVDRTVRQRENQ